MDYTIAHAVYRSTAELTPTETLLLYSLAGAAKDPSTLPSPSVARLADRSRLAERTVLRTIAGLEAKGILSISKRRTQSGKQCNVYIVNRNRLGQQPAVLESVTPDSESYNNNIPDCESPMTVCHLTPDSESPVPLTQSHPTPDTESPINNISNNKENNNNKQASIVESNIISTPTPPQTEKPKMQTTPQVTQSQATPAAAAACGFDLIDIGLAALARLKADGIDDKEAKEKLQAVADAFKCEAKDLKKNGFRGISNPKAYLTAKLYGMAKEGPKQATPQAEPTRLEEIFELLKREWIAQYPEVADRIKSFGLLDLPPTTENKLRAKEDADWKSVKGSRLAYLSKTLEGTIYERVQAWRQDELKEVAAALGRVTSKLAQLRFEPKAYYDPRKTVEDEIAELEEREKKCRAKLARLTACTSRPNAA